MSSEVPMSLGKKCLKDLRVTELKTQLEKRGLATSGVKAVLMERLQSHLSEGQARSEEDIDLDAPVEDAAAAASAAALNSKEEDDSIRLTIEEDEEHLFDEEDKAGEGVKGAKEEEEKPKGKEAQRTEEEEEGPDSLSKEKQTQHQGEKQDGKDPESALGKGREAEEEDSSRKRSLWISGLASSYRASDLEKVFSKHGTVLGAKVVTNPRNPGAKCYGYVTMSSEEEAAACITHLHHTKLHNKRISVELAGERHKNQSNTEEEEETTQERGGEEAASDTRTKKSGRNNVLFVTYTSSKLFPQKEP
eukprot:TRINITY_DN738_c0_g1_i4.p1 TRINITY_DN738_c0_g1~~TRINITY_DN738_c0_g1_i4.p1  ORF type:complete len:305 (-),score=123.40 TRINITY_DN738_c0_g1_i4:1422-2336(-)